jgi:hypothetical protein
VADLLGFRQHGFHRFRNLSGANLMDIYLPLIAVGLQSAGLFLAGLYFLRKEEKVKRTSKDFALMVRKIQDEVVQVAEHLERLSAQTPRS